MSNVFKTCSLHSAYHTGCIDCQHDMDEEISILKADNARMREALESFHKAIVFAETHEKTPTTDGEFGTLLKDAKLKCEQALKGEG